MIEKLHLSESNKKILESILNKYRADFDFVAFGSRVTGQHKEYSDLDLAIKNKKKLSLSKLKQELEQIQTKSKISEIIHTYQHRDYLFKALREKGITNMTINGQAKLITEWEALQSGFVL